MIKITKFNLIARPNKIFRPRLNGIFPQIEYYELMHLDRIENDKQFICYNCDINDKCYYRDNYCKYDKLKNMMYDIFIV